MNDDLDIEADALTSSFTAGRPVWVEEPDGLAWVAYDPVSNLKLRMELHPVNGPFRRPIWVIYATNRDGQRARPVAAVRTLDPSIHIAENIAARGGYKFPTKEQTR